MIYTKDFCRLRISLTESALSRGFFEFYDLAVPTTIQYKPFSGKFSQSTGGQVLHGFQNITLTWPQIDSFSLGRIKKFVDNALSGTRLLYLTIPINDGSSLGRKYIDVSGTPYPVDANEGGNIAGGLGVYYTGFELFLNNVQIINNPATF